MVFSLAYTLVRCLIGLVAVLSRGDLSKEIELLVLRHENAVLRRQVPRPRYQARNRVPPAVERTVPFGLLCYSITVLWYATAGHDPADAKEHRSRARWYTTKAEPSFDDMIVKLRRVVIAHRFRHPGTDLPEPEDIRAVQLAWAAAGT